MSDEQKTESPEKAPEPGQPSEEKINENVLRPIDELVKSMQVHDEAIRKTLATLKRLWKKSKGAGQASLTEHVQLYAALYGLLNLKSTQDVIVGQQLSADIDRLRWHVFAVQNFVLEKLLGGPKPTEGDVEDEVEHRVDQKQLAEDWQAAEDRINALYKAEQEKAKEKRRQMMEQHKDDVLDGALAEMKRPALEKKEPEEGKGKILTLPN